MRLNKQEIAELFCVTPKTVGNWITNGLENHKDGRVVMIDVLAVHKFLIASYRQSLFGSDEEILDLDMERAKLARSQTTKNDLDIAKRTSGLLDLEEVRDVISSAIIRNRTHLLKLPAKISDRLNLDRGQGLMVSKLIEEVLEDMSIEVYE